MKKVKADRRVLILFYLLIFYIVIQFVWWAYMLIQLNTSLYTEPEILEKKIWMVVGEGLVFFIFLLAGVYIMQRSIRKEMDVVRQQRNFLLSITHELKTPIAAIKLCIETLERHKSLGADKRHKLQSNALENTDRLSKLVDKVLLATRVGDLDHEQVNHEIDLSQLTSQIIARYVNSGLDGKKINAQISTGIVGRIDPQYFDSILTNLVENAIKYGGGSPVQITLGNTASHVVLKVVDEGPGIQQKNKGKVFDQFFREGNEETRTKKGTGLGLFIVKKLVVLHGGNISLSNNQPQGSIFEVQLPIIS